MCENQIMVKILRWSKQNKLLFKPVQNTSDYNNQDGHNPDICKQHLGFFGQSCSILYISQRFGSWNQELTYQSSLSVRRSFL